MSNQQPETDRHAILEWATKTLNEPLINITTLVQTPWSSVLKIATSQGNVYLKQTPPDLFIETEIINAYRNLCKLTNIPEVIASNKNLHCFLMKECGDLSLRTLFNGQLKVGILIQGLQIYKKMQQATAPYVNDFIQLGVSDWRLKQFPTLYNSLVSNDGLLKSHGLETVQIKKLQDLSGSLQALCDELGLYAIPDCLNHSDFHENNMLFCKSTKQVSIIDLGETAIDHPFFALYASLTNASFRYQLKPESRDYQLIHDACFHGWLSSEQDLQKVLTLIPRLFPIYLVFAHMRLVNATCPVALSNIPRMNSRVRETLARFVEIQEGSINLSWNW